MSQKHLLSELKLFLSCFPLLLKVKHCLILFQMTFIFSETVRSQETSNCFPISLISWCFSLLGQDVDCSDCASLPASWVEGNRHFSSHSCLGVKNAWMSCGLKAFPLCSACELLRCRSWQESGEMGPPQDVRLCLFSLWWWRWDLLPSLWLPRNRVPAGQVAFQGRVSLKRGLTRGLCHYI